MLQSLVFSSHGTVERGSPIHGAIVGTTTAAITRRHRRCEKKINNAHRILDGSNFTPTHEHHRPLQGNMSLMGGTSIHELTPEEWRQQVRRCGARHRLRRHQLFSPSFQSQRSKPSLGTGNHSHVPRAPEPHATLLPKYADAHQSYSEH